MKPGFTFKKTKFSRIVLRLCIVSFLFSMIVSCGYIKNNKKIESALEQAGTNRKELEKVIEHYKGKPEDSLKLKAAYFLIENMPGHFSYDTTNLYKYRPVIEKIGLLRNKGFSKGIIKEQVNPLMDSLITIYPLSHIYSKREDDLTSIKSQMLIDNIDLAFEYYNKNPFKDSIIYDDFLEYVLPYRIQNGYCLEDWRAYFTQYYSNRTNGEFLTVHEFCDSLLHIFNDVKIAWRVADQFPYLKLEDYLRSKMTHCPQKCWFNCILLRSFGVPVTVDFVPVSRVHTLGHEWNVLKLKEGIYPFEPFWVESFRYLKPVYSRQIWHPEYGPLQFPKVYRKTFKMNISELFEHAVKTGEDIPPFFRNPFQKDVTNEYFKTYDIDVPLNKKIKDVDYAYACVLGQKQRWVPVGFGKIKGGKVLFQSLGPTNVYLPAFYKFSNLIFAGYPILLSENGSSQFLCPDTTHTRQVEISHVAYPRPELKIYKEAFIGATIEGSNNNFETSETLYHFNKMYEPGTYHIPFHSAAKFRFVRFTIPKGKLKLNEIKFYSGNDEIKGELISSNPTDNLLFQKIVDEDLITGHVINNLGDDKNFEHKVWVGYDFGEPVSVSAFEFYFVFNANIRKEGIYELLYWDFGWKSLEMKVSNSTKPLHFDNVPDNALLMIKIHDTDSYSRIFTYSEGKQHWW